MTTFCSKCGSSLAADARFCPQCGTVTSSYSPNSGASQYDPTAVSSSSGAPLQAPPTDYGSPSYGAPQQNPYEPLNPYEAPLPPPPPPSSRRLKLGLLVGIVVLVLIIVSGSVVALLILRSKNISIAQTSIPATGTANAEKNPYRPYTGTLVLNDPLSGNSKGYNWQEHTGCQFTGDGYHVTSNSTDKGAYYVSCNSNVSFSNFAFQIQMKIIKGDCGGMIFREDNTESKFYYFSLCQDGSYIFYLYPYNPPKSNILATGSSPAIRPGLNQLNVIAIVANGSSIDLYINNQYIDSTSENTYSQGKIGVTADTHFGNSTEVIYTDAMVWTLQ